MRKTNLIITFVTVLIAFNFCFPANLLAAFEEAGNIQAGIYIMPDFELFLDPEFLFVDITADTGINAVNAAGINMQYDPARLQIAQIDYAGSFCTKFINETADNANGAFNLNCGTTMAVSSSTLQIARIKFIKLNSGWTNLALSDSRLLASDGLGSEILIDNEVNSIYIIKN